MNTKENLSRGILVDNADMHLLANHLFCISDGYPTTTIFGRNVRLHILILTSASLVDHKDGNKLNNKRGNLRQATKQQNSFNQKKPKNNTSGYKGVFKDKNKWRAAIMVDGHTKSLGSYTSKEQAALMYDFAAAKYHGEFAKFNFDLTLP